MIQKIIVLILLLNSVISVQSQVDFKQDFQEFWSRAKTYSIEVAELMPEDQYGYKATPEVRSFQEHLIHIARNLYWLTSTFALQEDNPSSEIDFSDLSKKETIEALRQSFNYVDKAVESIRNEDLSTEVNFGPVLMPKQRVFLLMRDHMTHHRAQMILYLRLNGITPPEYRGW